MVELTILFWLLIGFYSRIFWIKYVNDYNIQTNPVFWHPIFCFEPDPSNIAILILSIFFGLFSFVITISRTIYLIYDGKFEFEIQPDYVIAINKIKQNKINSKIQRIQRRKNMMQKLKLNEKKLSIIKRIYE